MLSSASELARAEGLDSLAEACRISGRRAQTLHKWHKENPSFFQVVIAGCGEVKRRRAAKPGAKRER